MLLNGGEGEGEEWVLTGLEDKLVWSFRLVTWRNHLEFMNDMDGKVFLKRNLLGFGCGLVLVDQILRSSQLDRCPFMNFNSIS